MLKCPVCKGEGGGYDAVLWNGIGGGPWENCYMCRGKGDVSLSFLINLWMWEHLPIALVEWWDGRRQSKLMGEE